MINFVNEKILLSLIVTDIRNNHSYLSTNEENLFILILPLQSFVNGRDSRKALGTVAGSWCPTL